MPSGRDSFRRNRVAPNWYDSLHPYYITRPKSDVAAEGSAATSDNGFRYNALSIGRCVTNTILSELRRQSPVSRR